MEQNSQNSKDIKSFALKLAIVPLLMFGFGFALVPLYDVFCEVTGFNGKTGAQVSVEESVASQDEAESRQIKVQFLAMNNEYAQIDFKPGQSSVTVKPGEVKEVFYTARNLTDREMVSQSVPSVSPLEAAEYVKKVECFCFENQTLAPGETKVMPLRFFVDKELPKQYTKLSLNYTIFDITEPNEAEELAQEDHGHHSGHQKIN